MSPLFANVMRNHAEDGAVLLADNTWVGRFSGKTLQQLQERDPHIMLVDGDIFVEIVERRMTTDPVEITESDYWYLLEVLPPCSWQKFGDTESFYMSEFTNLSVTCHVVRIGKQYFKFEAPVMHSHSDRVAKVLKWRREGNV